MQPKPTSPLVVAYWILTLVLFTVGVYLVVYVTPDEATMGAVQKIFYLHLPAAINTFVACLVCCIAGVGYLWQHRVSWDDLGAAAARVAVLLCSVTLLTGMVWAHAAWGVWWTWTPRLTFTLLLWLLYVVYLMIRPSIESPRRRAIVCAVYGLVAFLDVPLIYLSVRLIPEIHPTSIKMEPVMKATLLYWFLPVTMFNFGLIAALYRQARAHSIARLAESEQESPRPAGLTAIAAGDTQ